jgi:ribosomal protein S18 acetylase RimI-like enzyme
MLERIYSVAGLQAEMSAGHCFWIAYDSMDAVGFASAYREDAAVIWLKKIYVDPARQGQGVGKQLIRTAMHAFGAARELRLLVNPNNLPGQRYYEYQHFIRIGEKPVMMGDWAFNDFIYSKPITD